MKEEIKRAKTLKRSCPLLLSS